MTKLEKDSGRSSEQPHSARVTSPPINRKLDDAQLEKLTALTKNYRGTNADLAKAAKLAPSTVSMILSGVRAPSVKVTARLARALCPPEQSLESFTSELLALVGHDPAATAYTRVSETIGERVERTGEIRAVYVASDPFVDANLEGFSVELFEYIARLLRKRVVKTSCRISELKGVLERGEADVAVSAILPTFQRQSYMWFSNPLPYLRVPLSALVRKNTTVESGAPLTVEHVLNWTSGRYVDGLGNIKILLVEEEVGHDFVKTFLKSVRPKDLEVVKTLVPEELYRRFSSDPKPDLLLADMATCAAIYELSQGDLEPLPDNSPIAKLIQRELAHSQFPVLALYPITFGLPMDDRDWRDTINRALGYLMSEGVRILLSLYDRYLARAEFRDFCVGDDELVASKPLQQMFKVVFERHPADKKSGERLEPKRQGAKSAPSGRSK